MILLSNGKPIGGIPSFTKTPIRQRIVHNNLRPSVRRTTIVNAMKLTAIFLFSLLMRVHATSYAQKVTLTAKDAKLESVFNKISRQTGYLFFYNDQLIRKAQPVTVDLKDVPLEQALKAIFSNQPFVYMISEKNIAVGPARVLNDVTKDTTAPPKRERPSPNLHVFFKVVDAITGDFIPGVYALIEGDNTGTVSDEKGEARISAPKGKTIIFSYIGYEEHREKITETNLNVIVRLRQKPQEMKTTVVTGIFNRKASSYTGAAVTFTGEELRKVSNANVFQSLKNIAPSMVLDNFSLGSNPNALPSIQLRGTSTFPADASDVQANLKGNYLKNPNEPLFILDGFEASLERIYDLDMNRIERMIILKDAASKAIYGAKAANGVIVIETKKSVSNRPLVTYNASVDIDIPDLTSYNLTNAHEKLQAELIDGMYDTKQGFIEESVRLKQLYNARKKLADEGLNTDWMAKPLREGIGHKHNLSIDLSGPTISLLADLTYREVNGVMIGSQRKNIAGNLTASYRVKNFQFRNITSINSNKNTESPYGQFDQYTQMNPYWKAVNADGTIPYYAEVIDINTKYTNPLFNATINTRNTSEYFNFTDNFYVEWNIIPGLKAISRLGLDVKNNGADEFYPASHTMFESYTQDDDLIRRGRYQINNGKSNRLSGDLNLQYTKNLGIHSFFANLGGKIEEKRFTEMYHVVEGFTSDRMENVLMGRQYLLDSRPLGQDYVSREAGFLGSFSYTYDNRYFTDLTFRTSASSQFGSDKRWAPFWSAGFGWNIHNEQFFAKRFPFLTQFKVRGSVGSTGNPNFATNASVATYEYYRDRMYQGFPGSYVLNIPNPNLQWETKMDYNIGADISLRNKLNIRFDYYESFTENLIARLSLPSSVGFPSVAENLGKVKNSGIELYASWMLWSKGNNFFSINGSIETNTNKIISLSESMKEFNKRMDLEAAKRINNVPVKKYIDGMSMNTIWAVPSLGIDPANGREVYLKKDGTTTYTYDPSDMIAAGNSLPKYTGTFGISGEYNGFGLNITGRYLGGNQLYNQTLVDRVENVDMAFNVDKRVITGRWLHPGQQALFKRLGSYTYKDDKGQTVNTTEKTRVTTRFVQDRNELSIGAISAYYQFRDVLVKKLKMQRLRLGFNMNEIATFSSIQIERGTAYPFARTLSFSLSATF